MAPMQHPNRVLIVDSNHAGMIARASALRERGWDPVLAGDAAAAVRMARETAPEIIVLAPTIAGGTQLTVLQRMRASVYSACVPIIAVDATSEPEQLYKAGVQDCVSEDLLVTALERHRANQPDVPAPPLGTLTQAERVTALDRSGLLDSPAEVSFDRLTALASSLLRARLRSSAW